MKSREDGVKRLFVERFIHRDGALGERTDKEDDF
jgi:hypothetical protein